MANRDKKKEPSILGPINLSIFPVNHTAVQRLAQTLSPNELRQSRLTTITTILGLLEPLLRDIETIETLAATVDHPASTDLIKSVAKMREIAERLYDSLGDSFKWV